MVFALYYGSCIKAACTAAEMAAETSLFPGPIQNELTSELSEERSEHYSKFWFFATSKIHSHANHSGSFLIAK